MLLGPDVQDMDRRSAVDYAGYHLKADGYIPRGQSYFDPEGNGGSLNNKILIFLPGEAIRRVGQTEKSTALCSAVFFDADLGTLVELARNDFLYLVEHDLDREQPESFRSLLVVSAVYIVGALALMLIALILFSSASLETLRESLPDLAVRRLFGAPRSLLLTRVYSFLAFVIVLPALAPLLFYSMLSPYHQSAAVIAGIIALIYAFAAVRATRYLTSKDVI